MTAHLETFISNCEQCATYRQQQRKEPLMVSSLPGRPWMRVAADLFQYQDSHYLLLVDYYSRYPEVYRLSSLQSVKVIEGLKQAFSRYGIPDELISDNGPQFTSTEFHHFMNLYGCNHITSSPRHPQGNGLVERTVQTIKRLLKKSTPNTGNDFYLALLAYRSTPHESTGISPACTVADGPSFAHHITIYVLFFAARSGT